MSEPIRFAEPIPVGQEEVIGPTLLKYISELQRQAANAEALRLQLSRARELLEQCKDKLALYRNEHSGEYVGGVEYTALVRGLTEFLKEVGK